MRSIPAILRSSTVLLTAVMAATLAHSIPANAQTTPQGTFSEQGSQAANCAGANARAREAVNIRSDPRTLSGPVIGIVQKGQIVCVTGGTHLGAQYTACGRTSTEWYSIVWQNVHNNRYVAATCMDFV